MPIVKRGRKWQATINHKGERYRRAFEAYVDAETWEAQTKLDIRAGRAIDLGDSSRRPSAGVTLGQLREETLKHRWAGSKGERTHVLNSRLVMELLGADLPVTQISTRRIEDMIFKLTQIGNGDSTINRKVSCLSTMLRYAVMHKYIPVLPHIPKKKEPEHRIRWMTDQEQAEILAFFHHIGNEDMEDIVKLSLDTGIRRGELLRIQARDIHEQQLHIWESKSGKARTVPLTKRASAVLGKRSNRTEHPTDKLFVGWTGDGIRHYWDRARQHMGMMHDPQFVPHVMRHTFCSMLAMRGVPIPAIKELAGHSSIVTTQRYVHMAPNVLSEAIGTLEQDSRLQSADTSHDATRGGNRGVASNRPSSGYQTFKEISNLSSIGR